MGFLARIVRNLLALATSLVLERAISLVLFLFIARRLGQGALGQYALAFSFLTIFEAVSVFGQNLLVIREVARDHRSAGRYLVNSSLIVLVVSVLCAGAMPLVARGLGYPAEMVYYILLVGVVLIPDSLSAVPESVLQGWERMEYITLLRFATNLVGTAAAILFLLRGAGLASVFWVLVVQRTLLAAAYAAVVWRQGLIGTQLRPDRQFCAALVRVSGVFVGISIFAAVFKNVDVWILSSVAGSAETGVYAAADRPIALIMLAVPILMTALFPSLAETYRSSPERFERLLESSLRGLAATVPFAAILLSLAAPGLVALLYGPGYERVVLPMQVLAWTLVPTFLAALLFRVLLASNNERVSLQVSFINVVANVGLNLWLIPRLGAVGASLVALFTGMLGLAQNYWHVDRRLVRIRPGKAFAKPLAAIAVSAVIFLALPASWHIYLRGGLTALAYAGLLAAMRVLSAEERAALVGLAQQLGGRIVPRGGRGATPPDRP